MTNGCRVAMNLSTTHVTNDEYLIGKRDCLGPNCAQRMSQTKRAGFTLRNHKRQAPSVRRKSTSTTHSRCLWLKTEKRRCPLDFGLKISNKTLRSCFENTFTLMSLSLRLGVNDKTVKRSEWRIGAELSIRVLNSRELN